MVAIGIDLGTTHSCVGVWQNGSVQIIPNEQGDRTTPSYVAFTDYERLVGDLAKTQVSMNPSNSVFDIKRIIGKKFHDPKIQEEVKHWPFAVLNEAGKPKINVLFKDEWKIFSPEEITSMILTNLKQTAESYLGTLVKDAVISVPASFSDSQRQATKDAATIAGLNVLRLINEPTASALAYGLDKKVKGERKVLIFDLGGGTLDVSVISIDDGSLFEVLSTSGNPHLGGIDFDNKLVNYFIEVFETNYKKDLRTDPRAIRRLRTAAEKAKISLSYSTEVSIEIETLYEGIDFFTVITRTKFEELCADLFRSTLNNVEKALEDANINKCAIDDIILVGGSTRIPKIQHLLRSYFFGKRLNYSLNPDESVATGAAIQAAILDDCKDPKIRNLLLVDVVPMTLGIEIAGTNEILPIIQKHTRIPCKKTFSLPTFAGLTFNVFENSRNNLLGTFDIHRIPSAPEAKVVLDVDSNGILNVSAALNDKYIAIKQDKGRLSYQDITRMVSEAEEYRIQDEKQRKCIEVRNILEGHVLSLKRCALNLSNSDKTQLKMLCDEVLVWLESNVQANVEDYEDKMKDFISLCKPVLKNRHKKCDCFHPLIM